ncbi:nucleotidyltransferase family protein [Mucilaginibacter sp. L3T2-6]|uniref:nucleotidyltransferase family protein n=1 Tax=Mucilaginibacter sp. L3T2-6 TaxID=3062491 RepID=UPI002676317E|nr:nucleotidyltransferase family protein [Mucilaginibacter sp. L3T2-6]MDO3642478.1 nucleotidyltransferase family protein [Mucilaginibacter sp. L3T2-6]MDV6215126.1 nucleotidyltransferase family protein [Mucilaginibacter sp. L3T2-6]
MNYDYKKHLILSRTATRAALSCLDKLAADAILFVVDKDNKLIGSLTDGDVRRGLLKGLTIDDEVDSFLQKDPKKILKGNYDVYEIIKYRNNAYKVLPVVDEFNVILNVVNFRFSRSYLPIDAVIMAGGRGERLRPLTDDIPKPLLPVAGKPIIKHNIDRLVDFGIDDLWISVRYLGEQIKSYLGDGSELGVKINYVIENAPLGTIGAVSLIDKFTHDYVLLTNSDILTNLDYENFFLDFITSDADYSVATIPYNVSIPYAILETSNGCINSFKEKPTYTYYANAGIYLMKKEVCSIIPRGEFYDATDLLHHLIINNYKVISYPLRGYWLDVGKHEDYKKAQDDINYIKF